MSNKKYKSNSNNNSRNFKIVKIFKKTIEREEVCKKILQQLYYDNMIDLQLKTEEIKKEM